MSNGDLVHGEGKLTSEESPLLASLKSKPAPNGVSPLAICQKPEVIDPIAIPCSFDPPSRNQTLWSWVFKSQGLVCARESKSRLVVMQ